MGAFSSEIVENGPVTIFKNTILIGKSGEKERKYGLLQTNLEHKNVHLRTEFEKIEEQTY